MKGLTPNRVLPIRSPLLAVLIPKDSPTFLKNLTASSLLPTGFVPGFFSARPVTTVVPREVAARESLL